MPLDAIFLTALTDELQPSICGARIHKIQMPERDMLVFSLHGPAGDQKLLVNTGTGRARFCLTGQTYDCLLYTSRCV